MCTTNTFMTSSFETCKASKQGLSLASYNGRRSSDGPGCFARTASRVSWFTGAGVSPEQMILTAALKLSASNLSDTAAASLLLSLDFLLALLSVVWQWTVGTVYLSHAAVRLLMILLKFLFEPPLFGSAKITGPKCSNSSQAALLLGLPIILLKVCEQRCAGCSCGPWNAVDKRDPWGM